MFNKIKKLAKKVVDKTKEVVKYISDKAEEYVMAKEQIELKKIELVINKLANPKVMFILLSGIGAMAIVSAGTTFIVYKNEILK